MSEGLVTRKTIVDAAKLNPPLAKALNLLPSGIDVKTLYERLMAAVESDEPLEIEASA